MYKKFVKIILLVILITVVILPQLVLAEADDYTSTLKKLEAIGEGDSGPYAAAHEDSMFEIISTVISGALALLGVIFLVLMLYAGYGWMMARGEEEKVTKAKETITRAIVGIIIVVAAYAISIFVISKLEANTLKGGGVSTSASQAAPVATCESKLSSLCIVNKLL